MEVVRRAGPSRLTKRDCLLVALVFGGVILIASARAHERFRQGRRAASRIGATSGPRAP